MIGGEFVENDDCPVCFANQRIRLTFAILKKAGLPKAGTSVLHIAPELALYAHLFNSRRIEYVAADLFPDRYRAIPDVQRADVTDLQFPDGAFDLVLCNHVLEHVPDDRLAMRELRRVLKPGGVALLQAPMASKLAATVEDPSVTDPAERERRFGQFDHIRLYAEPDYVRRLNEAGFLVHVGPLSSYLSDAEIARYELNVRERLFIAGSQASIAAFLSAVGSAR